MQNHARRGKLACCEAGNATVPTLPEGKAARQRRRLPLLGSVGVLRRLLHLLTGGLVGLVPPDGAARRSAEHSVPSNVSSHAAHGSALQAACGLRWGTAGQQGRYGNGGCEQNLHDGASSGMIVP
jgi:hypothetical protein